MSIETDPEIEVKLPQELDDEIAQDEEWCWVRYGDDAKRVRFHDYHEIYSIPGLYEQLFYDKLKCCSPEVVTNLLEEEIEHSDTEFSELKVLDLGAGNGMVGEALHDRGAGAVIGVDIIEEAAKATGRDRPGIYDDYLVDDLTAPSDSTRAKLESEKLNCLTTVAALGFGDIPPLVFCEAFNSVEIPGWVAFNIKEDFLEDTEPSGFSALIRKLLETRILELKTKKRYRHRLSLNGSPLYYVACVGIKRENVPGEWLEEMRRGDSPDSLLPARD